MNQTNQFTNNLGIILDAKQITLSWLAQQVGKAPLTIANMRDGTPTIRLDTLTAVANALQIDPRVILSWETPPPQNEPLQEKFRRIANLIEKRPYVNGRLENKLRVAMAEKRMGVGDLATAVGKTSQAIINFKNGTPTVRFTTWTDLASALDVSPWEIIVWTPQRP